MRFPLVESCSLTSLVQASYTGPVDYDAIDNDPSKYYDSALLPAHLKLKSAAITGGWFLDLFEYLMVKYCDNGGVFALKGPNLETPISVPLKAPEAAVAPSAIAELATALSKMLDAGVGPSTVTELPAASLKAQNADCTPLMVAELATPTTILRTPTALSIFSDIGGTPMTIPDLPCIFSSSEAPPVAPSDIPTKIPVSPTESARTM